MRITRLPGPAERAALWLEERLADGPVRRVVIVREAAAIGIPRNTLARGAANLGIISEVIPGEYPRRTTWRLP